MKALFAAVVAVLLVAGVVAAVQNSGPSAAPTPTPSVASSSAGPSLSPSPRPSASQSVKPSVHGSTDPVVHGSPFPRSSDAICSASTGGTIQETFDATQGWSVVRGHGALFQDPTNKAEGAAAMFFNNGTQTAESWALKKFGSPKNFSGVSEFRIWLLQEGNLVGNTIPWRMRLITDTKNYFERVFPQARVSAATRWCQDHSARAEWTATGSPRWSKITGIEVGVPNYTSGARNYVGFDSFRTA